MFSFNPWRPLAQRRAQRTWTGPSGLLVLIATAWLAASAQHATAQEPNQERLVHRVQDANDRLEMVVNTSRILTLGKKIPQAQVNNPDILDLTALSATQVQVLAKKAGVTQVNLWDENDEIYTVDVMVYGDAQELSMLLKNEFPNSSLKVVPLAQAVLISGYVDDPNQVQRIITIAEDYHPKVINNITVGGVQQVLLQVRVMEVSRTKLRSVGVDFSNISAGGDFVTSSVSGFIAAVSNSAKTVTTTGGSTFQFGIIDAGNSFFGIMELLQQRNLAKILAEPNMVTVSGRPAFFNVGGEFPILVPQSLGTVSIQYRKFGTQVDFVPIVLGNGTIRLEVRPRVSEIDESRSVVLGSTNVPALRVREVDTGVEMKAGQTLAIAGLVQNRVESQVRGVPWLSDLPWVGGAFRKVRETNNEIELLILVTPQLVEAMDACDVPPGGPGLDTASPNDVQLYMRGHLETPRRRPQGGGEGYEGEGVPTEEVQRGEPEGQMTPSEEPRGEVEGDSAPAPTNEGAARAPRRGSHRHASSGPRIFRQTSSATGEGRNGGKVGRDGASRSSRRSRAARNQTAEGDAQPGLIGPIGYDVSK